VKKPTSTLYKLVLRGRVPGHKLGRSWRFDREEVDSWLKSQKPGAPKCAKQRIGT
jgi:excisionase family DNA binding protein